MTSAEAATILAILHGAYPRNPIDEAVTHVWENTLLTADYRTGQQAANEWVALQQWWPTPAEFNGLMRRIRESNETPSIAPSTKIANMQEAQMAFSEGYRRSRRREGDTEEQIQEKLGQYLRRWPQGIPGVGVS